MTNSVTDSQVDWLLEHVAYALALSGSAGTLPPDMLRT
jgi:hypothetical protein